MGGAIRAGAAMLNPSILVPALGAGAVYGSYKASKIYGKEVGNFIDNASKDELINYTNSLGSDMFESGLVAGSYVAAKAKLAEPERKPIPIWDIKNSSVLAPNIDDSDELSEFPLYRVNAFAKYQHKQVLWAIARSSINPDMCKIKVYSNGQKVQIFTDLAHRIVPNIDTNLYSRANVIGILQHKAATEIYKEYDRVCDDNTFKTEVSFKEGIPDDSTKGSTRADFVTKNIAQKEKDKLNNFLNPYELKEHYNLKFGAQDVLQVEYKQHLVNLPKGTDFYQVKPGEEGPREVKEMLESKKKVNE